MVLWPTYAVEIELLVTIAFNFVDGHLSRARFGIQNCNINSKILTSEKCKGPHLYLPDASNLIPD